MPLTTIDCGLPVPLLAMVIVAARPPNPDGANPMLNVHEAPAFTVAQVELLTGNSPALLLVIAVTVTAAPPMLLTVTVCAALDVPMVVSGIVTEVVIDSWPPGGGVPAMPVPESEIDSAPPPA